MAYDVVLIGWNRAVAGRERDAVELFGTAVNFYESQKKAGTISAHEHFFLDPHGGDLNGFTVLRGERNKLSTMLNSDEWHTISAKAVITLEGFGAIHGVTGEGIQKRMGLYSSSIPKK
jgi:hypothetical protein